MEFYSRLETQLREKYPELTKLSRPLSLDHLVTFYKVTVPQQIADLAKKSIKEMFKLAHLPEYKEFINPIDPGILSANAPNYSVLMAYDFHYIPETQELKLIEVNTNASGYLFANELYDLIGCKSPSGTRPLDSLLNSFKGDINLFYEWGQKKITIIDEDIESQNMYPEFLMYKSLFEREGYEAKIRDCKDLVFTKEGLVDLEGDSCGYIYNRFCDFTLNHEKSAHLRKAYLEKTNAFSPNPSEYVLLADKERLTELTCKGCIEQFADKVDIEPIKEILLPSFEITKYSKEEVWAKRKQYFFKPQRSFGGKSSYKGSSISKKVFERLYEENSLVQKFAPPARVERENGQWKYDLRFYVYKDEIQNVAARLYQGQVTNFSQPHGGFACVDFV